ncbi:MAG: HAD family hydrolase [Treponemataceae bacterium]
MCKIKIAILYDFDKTLCTKDMQEYTFIPKVQMTAREFWTEASKLASEKKMDRILAYMYLMLEKAKEQNIGFRREDFVALGRDLEFFEGVETWFPRINTFAESLNLNIEHYIISSGLYEIIEGSKIMKYFHRVFACEFLYDKNNFACWSKNAVNYTTKTQFLFRISKGALDISDDTKVNSTTNESQFVIPFRNMIYIGDGLTDIPCMKLIKSYGGQSIAVYQKGKSEVAQLLLKDKRVDFIFPADYSENSELEKTVQKIIRKIKLESELRNQSANLIRKIQQ